jgi:restriction endonuclease S subunit
MYFSDFLVERKGLFEPDDERIQELTKIEKIDFSEGKLHLGKYKPTKTNQLIVEPNDLVFSGLNIEKGAVSLNLTGLRLVVSANYSTCKINFNVIDKEFLSYLIRSQYFKSILIDHLRKDYGFTRPKHLMPLSFIAPTSIEDQRQIVEKLKRTEVEGLELKSEIIHQQTLLKKLRQRILQEAIEGKLTADWRAQNPDVEPASELLKRIAAEKAKLVKDKKIKAQKPLPPITDAEKPFELPQGWEWCRLDQLIYESPRNGYSPKTVDFPTGIRTLKLGATTKGEFDAKEIKFVDESIPQDSYLWIKARDILIQRGNSIGFVGVSAIYYGEDNGFIYPDLMMKLRPVDSISEVYLHHALMSVTCREYFRKNASGAQKSMPKINQSVVSGALVPLCSEAEQKAIVTKVEKLLALCDQLETQVTQNQAHAEQLMQAVLKEAFLPDLPVGKAGRRAGSDNREAVRRSV